MNEFCTVGVLTLAVTSTKSNTATCDADCVNWMCSVPSARNQIVDVLRHAKTATVRKIQTWAMPELKYLVI